MRRHDDHRVRNKKTDGAMAEVKQELLVHTKTEARGMPTQQEVDGGNPKKSLRAGPFGENCMVDVLPGRDPFTCLRPHQLKAARAHWNPSTQEGADKLHGALLNGADWQQDIIEVIAAVSTKQSRAKKIMKKRLGSKAVKKNELLENTGQLHHDERGSQYIAAAARANDRAFDRPDIVFRWWAK